MKSFPINKRLLSLALTLAILINIPILPALSVQSQTPLYSTNTDNNYQENETLSVIFVGNNWDGMIDVIDATSFQHLGVINGIPDKRERMRAIRKSLFRLIFF